MFQTGDWCLWFSSGPSGGDVGATQPVGATQHGKFSAVACNADVVDLTGDAGDDEFLMEKCGTYGKPIEWDGKSHDFIDGFGLCSPTRWKPSAAGHNRDKAMGVLTQSTSVSFGGVREAIQDIRKEAFKLVTSPFNGELLTRLRQKLVALLRDPADALIKDDGQPFFLRLLAQWLEVFGDPDVDCLVNATDSFAAGVNVGVEALLPRSPHVFPPKRKHRKPDGTEFTIADNYISAQISAKELEEKLREEETLEAFSAQK
eukprot:s233_g18.t1